MELYNVIDLFSGAGGLSLGFMQTQKYAIKVAFENNPNMQETYKRNHPGVDVRGDVCSADYAEIQNKYGHIDVVIGGPPCQGFSNANRQKNHAISQNNMLVKQYIRAIRELQPEAFVMENVSMLRSDVHRFYLDEADAALINTYDIPMTSTKLVLLEKEYMFEGALDLVKDSKRIAKYLWPEDEYAALNVIYKATKNQKNLTAALLKHKKSLLHFAESHLTDDADDYVNQSSAIAFGSVKAYYQGDLAVELLQDAIAPAIMIQRMLSKALEIYDNHLVVDEYVIEGDLFAVIRSYAVFDYLRAILGAEPNNYAINADVLCAANYGAPQKRMRFVVIGIKKSLTETVKLPLGSFNEDNYRTVRDAIADLETVALKTNTYTDVSRTQNTIYLRLDYDQPCGTVVNVRKSMWVHPVLDRAVSVREAARLQTFPDSFVFCGTKDKQYQQVGNAVPPIMAKAIAKKLAQQLRNIEEKAEQ